MQPSSDEEDTPQPPKNAKKNPIRKGSKAESVESEKKVASKKSVKAALLKKKQPSSSEEES